MIEFMALNVLFVYLIIFEQLEFVYWIIVYLLVFIVCDAVLGLRLLIIVLRNYGHNFLGLLYFSI